MLEIKNIEVHGLERSLAASGNPMSLGEIYTIRKNRNDYVNFIKPYEEVDHLKNELIRGKKLGQAKSGSGHDNFLKGIIVQFDVKYPQYWTPEAQRYHWLDIISSQSKMHRLTTAGNNAEFYEMFNKYVNPEIIDIVQRYCNLYNGAESAEEKYDWFMKALSNLPMGYEMWETLSTNYLQLKTIYHQRKNHRLREDWGAFIKMCKELPLFLELIGCSEGFETN
jgi:hypothetical protein